MILSTIIPMPVMIDSNSNYSLTGTEALAGYLSALTLLLMVGLVRIWWFSKQDEDFASRTFLEKMFYASWSNGEFGMWAITFFVINGIAAFTAVAIGFLILLT